MVTRLTLKKLLSLSLIGISLLGILLLQSLRLQRLNSTVELRSSSQQQQQQQQQRAQAQLLALSQMPSFGFDNLIADWSFLQFLQYFGDILTRQQTGYSLSPYFFESIIPRDPYFARPYIFLSASTSAHAGQPEKAVALMEQGLTFMEPNFPADSYLVWRYKGLDEFLFLGDYPSAQVSLFTAADWVQQSDITDGHTIANSLRQTAQFLAQNPTGKEAQISAWAQVLAQAADEATRKTAIERIEALGGEIIISETGRVSVRYRTEEEATTD